VSQKSATDKTTTVTQHKKHSINAKKKIKVKKRKVKQVVHKSQAPRCHGKQICMVAFKSVGPQRGTCFMSPF